MARKQRRNGREKLGEGRQWSWTEREGGGLSLPLIPGSGS